MAVYTDMMKALRGGYTSCLPGCYSNTKRDKELSLHKFPRDVSLREKWVNSSKRKDFIPGGKQRVCSQHLHVLKSKADQISQLYFYCFLSPNREASQICLPLQPPANRKSIGTGKFKVLADAVEEEVDFLCGPVDSHEKERTDMKLENARMKQEIADMKQEIADMKKEIADMKQEIADMKQEIADMKQEINMLNLVFKVLPAVMMTLDSTLVFQVTLL